MNLLKCFSLCSLFLVIFKLTFIPSLTWYDTCIPLIVWITLYLCCIISCLILFIILYIAFLIDKDYKEEFDIFVNELKEVVSYNKEFYKNDDN